MTLASDYLDYAKRIADLLTNPSSKTFRAVKLSARKIQESFYGLTIQPPKVLDGLEGSIELLFQGNPCEWEKLLQPLTCTVPCTFPNYPASAPVYHRLLSLRRRLG